MEKGFNLKILPNTIGNIAYIDKPSTSEKLLLILHPYGKDAKFAMECFSFLGNHFHLILPDLPFHGKTTLNRDEFSSKDLASIIDSLADLYKDKTLYVLGHSLGARILSLASPHLKSRLTKTLFYGPEGIATPFTSFFFRPFVYNSLRPFRYLFIHTTVVENLGYTLYEFKLLSKIAYRFLKLHSSKDKKQNLLSLWKSLSKSNHEMKDIIRNNQHEFGNFSILVGKQDKTTPYKNIKGTNWEQYASLVEGGHFYLKENTKKEIIQQLR